MLDKQSITYLKLISVMLLLLGLTKCSSSKKSISKNPPPVWVNQTPVSSLYYVGIGSVTKNVSNYKEAARKSAIENLSNEISVQVSSESILQTIETNSGFEQEYKQLIQLNSDKYLEGYQMVEDYENETHYFVYYRLSKQDYQDLQERLLQEATNNCLNFILEGDKNQQDLDYRLAVINYTKALEALINYLDKNIVAEYNGKNEILPFLITRKIQQLHQSINLKEIKWDGKLIVGQNIPVQSFGVELFISPDHKIVNYPVLIEYRSQFKQITPINSNAQGRVYWDIAKIKSEVPNQSLKFSLATVSIIEQTTRNRIIRELLKNLADNEHLMSLNVFLPKVFIENYQKLPSVVFSELKSSLLQNKFEVNLAEKTSEIKLMVTIEEGEARKSESGLGISVELKAVVTFVNIQDNKILYSEAIHNIKGTQATPELAKNIAYQNLSNQISSWVIPLFANNYF